MSPDDAALADLLHACQSAREFLGGWLGAGRSGL
jgi:hypothetical protein